MKSLKTSYFSKSGKNPKSISIAGSSPKGFIGKKYAPLTPTWEMVRKYKLTGDEKTYREKYFKLIMERGLTPMKIYNDLGEGAIMLCWEKSGSFCHRHLIAEWMEKSGIKVTEI